MQDGYGIPNEMEDDWNLTNSTLFQNFGVLFGGLYFPEWMELWVFAWSLGEEEWIQNAIAGEATSARSPPSSLDVEN